MSAAGLSWEVGATIAIDGSRSSPNHGPRADDVPLDCVILHYTGMRDGPSAIDWLCNPASEVSCHYVVEEDGRILRLVPEARRAWHAGRSVWAGVTDMNSASIGIEVVNGGHDFGLPPFPETQIDAVIALCRDIGTRHTIRPERFLAHSDIAPARKRDPGERFPWPRLAASGVGRWPCGVPFTDAPTLRAGDEGAAVLAVQQSLATIGYGLAQTGTYDPETVTVVRAFQRRFRPASADGQVDAETAAVVRAVVGRSLEGQHRPSAST